MTEASVLTHDPKNPAEWRAHIQKYGYVIVHDVVPKENLDAVVEDIWKHTGASPDDPESWYRDTVKPSGMIEMYQYQSLWNNRQHPNVWEVFRAVHGTDKLWVSIDRANLKPPESPAHPEYAHKGMIHWDTDITKYPDIPFGVQGVLALTDTEPDQGGFQCIPETYEHLDEFLKAQAPERLETHNPDWTGYTPTRPRMKAGDLLIWTTLLLHGNSPNTSTRPRLGQYVSMGPAGADEAHRQERIRIWRENTHPSGRAFPGDPRGIEEQRPEPAKLTPLGRKLLGMDRW